MEPYIRDNGFYQRELTRKVLYYNRIAHVWCSYESRNKKEGEIIDRGIISFQLAEINGSWKIVNVLWNSETEKTALPEKYLKSNAEMQ